MKRPMARVPDPRPGLIFRYGYVWLSDYRKRPLAAGKDRPACIVMKVADVAEADLSTSDGSAIERGDVIILPITTSPPRPGDMVIALTPDEKRVCRLDPGKPSWLVVSEFNADIWPNADLSIVPGTDRFEFGMAPPGLLSRIGRAFAEARKANKVVGVRR
jgi:hypothetical protein